MNTGANPSNHEILYFIWRWKLVTVSMLGVHFYNDEKSRFAYRRAIALIKMNLILFIYESKSKRFSLTLTKKGFDILEGDLTHLKDKGFRSEHINHDLIVSAIHYGIYRLNPDLFSDVYTEQELRRNEMELYPSPIPQSSLHRADGYLLLNKENAQTVFALEVELSPKVGLEYARTRGRKFF